MVSVGDEEGMGYYIGPDKKGYKAEVKHNGKTTEKTFKLFSQAVEWVETIKTNKRKEDEDDQHRKSH